MKRMLLFCAAVCLAICAIARAQVAPRTAQAVLDQGFPQPAVSFLLLDARSGAVLANRWPDAGEPTPIGSLIKPFTAMAWAATHRRFPTVICRGTQDACWLPRGHGTMTLQSAITESCNAYFLSLARDLPLSDANAALAEYGLPRVNAADKTSALAGLSSSWRVRPAVLAAAYLKLEHDAAHSRFQPLLEGMRKSAAGGTARAVSASLPAIAVLAKTGTAACSHRRRASADGFTVLFFPAEDPRLFLLVREHGVTGA